MAIEKIQFHIVLPGEMKQEDLKENILVAAYYGDIDGLKRAVAENPASVNFTDKFSGGTALHMSAGLGNLSCIEFLVDCKNIDLFKKDNDGNDAIDRAFLIGHNAIINLLADRMYPNRHIGKNLADPSP